MNTDVQFTLVSERKVYADVATYGRNVGRRNAPAAFAFLVNDGFRVNAEVFHKAVGKTVRILYGFPLCIAHISVCFVEVAFHLVGLVITEQGKLFVHLVELAVYFFNRSIYLLLICCSFDVAFCLACSSLCLACNSFRICCSLFIFLSPLFVTLVYELFFGCVGSGLCLLFGYYHFSRGHCIALRLIKVRCVERAHLVVGCHLVHISGYLNFGQVSYSVVERFEVGTDSVAEVVYHVLGIVGKLTGTGFNMERCHFSADSQYFGVNAHVELTSELLTHPLLQFLIPVTAYEFVVCTVAVAV